MNTGWGGRAVIEYDSGSAVIEDDYVSAAARSVSDLYDQQAATLAASAMGRRHPCTNRYKLIFKSLQADLLIEASATSC